MKCKRTSDGRKHDHHTLQVMRQQEVRAVHEGQTATSVAAAFGLNLRLVFTWLAKFSDSGEEALFAKPIPGRPAKVSDEEMRWIAQAVRNHTPQQFGFDYALWTLSPILKLTTRQLGNHSHWLLQVAL